MKFIRGLPTKSGDEEVGRPQIDVRGRAKLLDLAVLHHHDAVGERHRLDLVMGDVDDRRLVHRPVQLLDLDAQLVAKLGVEIGERLVEQKDTGIADERPADRDALALSARELFGAPVEQRR